MHLITKHVMIFRRSNVCFILLVIVNGFKLSKSEMEGKIVGGKYAAIRQFPHSVFLEAACDREEWMCGSSLLNQYILLTAAHCLHGCSLYTRNDKIDTFGGSTDYSAKTTSVRSVGAIRLHPKYNEVTVMNDIGLAIVNDRFPLNEYMKRVIIPFRFPSATKGVVAGWGLYDEELELSSSKLKFLEVRLMPTERCPLPGPLKLGMICATSADGSKDEPAAGDSGSGLLVDDYYEIGLVSFKDSENPWFMVYTNVTFFYDWIMDNSKGLYCLTRRRSRNRRSHRHSNGMRSSC